MSVFSYYNDNSLSLLKGRLLNNLLYMYSLSVCWLHWLCHKIFLLDTLEFVQFGSLWWNMIY